MMNVIEDRYNGVIVDIETLPDAVVDFKVDIQKLLIKFKNKNLIWIKIPLSKSEFIPILTKQGFEFHHCDDKGLMLIKKIVSDSVIPTAKNYVIGVGAIVINNGKLLVIKDRFSVGYKLPGGHIEHKETIKEAIKREVYEETGISIEFESIVSLGHFKNGQFGESALYIVCTSKALSYDISIIDQSEIIEAKWIDINDFLNSDDVYPFNKSVVKAAIGNSELKLVEQPIKLKVLGGEVFI